MTVASFQPGPALTMQNARAVLEAGLAALRSGQSAFDLSALGQVDSSAVAALLAWRRAAQSARLPLQYQNIPSSLQSLTELYGVSDLLKA